MTKLGDVPVAEVNALVIAGSALGLELAARYLEARAVEIYESGTPSDGGAPTRGMMARIFRDEAKRIRERKGPP